MNNNKINNNFINQIKNKDLYEEGLFEYIISNVNKKELLNEKYHIYYRDSISVDSNFEGFLNYNFPKNVSEYKAMKEHIDRHISEMLLKPFYYVNMKSIHYVLGESGYSLLREYSIDNFFNKIEAGEYQKLNSDEEKFFIDFIMNYEIRMTTPSFYTKEHILSILINQKEYLNKLNDKSSVNIFYENKNLKSILSLYSSEVVGEITNNTMNEKELVALYLNKNFKKKMFDLSAQLENKNAANIVLAFEEKTKSNSILKWFEKLIDKGLQLSLAELDMYYSGAKKPINYQTHFPNKKTNILAVNEMISLLKLVKDGTQINDDELSKIFIATILLGRETPYIKLRETFELPQNIKMCNFWANINGKSLGNRSIQEVEAEILKNKMEQTLSSKVTQPKKIKI